jgi:hypothetical protein
MSEFCVKIRTRMTRMGRIEGKEHKILEVSKI